MKTSLRVPVLVILASAALFLLPEVGGDSVRPGICLYGGATDESHPAAFAAVASQIRKTEKVLLTNKVLDRLLHPGGRYQRRRA